MFTEIEQKLPYRHYWGLFSETSMYQKYVYPEPKARPFD